ncbi:Glycosyl transferase CpsG [Streptococcus infantarius subsp. infantarius]|nr:Glycosyl transferase CpsG [Streptococcus infantarius subsp. infantarius]MCO4527278.1 Glycosyl transferase CpsG [Streptococcus infantarius subsp. infantarius]MCO4629300.1 Glycosyl transferase CpsG [Streptococcus infantarius subsp. infantarius]
MIFVTVGTHEQPFNRLIEEVDCLKKENIITEDVFIQTGFSTYEPQYCEWKNIISYDEMESYMKEATIVITHGGPATFMSAITHGKKPIVVPRQEKFGEHVNDHQLEFAQQVSERFESIVVVDKIDDLKEILKTDLTVNEKGNSNNLKFNDLLKREVESLVK